MLIYKSANHVEMKKKMRLTYSEDECGKSDQKSQIQASVWHEATLTTTGIAGS